MGSIPLRLVSDDFGVILPAPAHLFPIASDFSAWYAGDYVLALIFSLALVGFGFYTSLAGQPLFRGSLPDD